MLTKEQFQLLKYNSNQIKISRVSKVTKGGKKLSFRAVVVIGDENGKVGVGVAKADDVVNAFKKATKIVSETARTKIVEKTDSFIHAEAKTKWRRYTDDLLLKAIPEKGIIQVRSESRVGVGDNGVNQKRVDDFAYRLMTE